MAKYRVRPGFRFGAYDQHEPGTVVELTEAEAAGFRDKLERVAEPAQVHQDEPPGKTEDDAPPADPAGTPDSPQEDVPSDPGPEGTPVGKDEPEEPPVPEPPKGKKRS